MADAMRARCFTPQLPSRPHLGKLFPTGLRSLIPFNLSVQKLLRLGASNLTGTIVRFPSPRTISICKRSPT